MPQKIKKGVNALVAEALDGLPAISVEDAMALVDDDSYVFVDVREGGEQARGIISGAVPSSRGMLEYHIDPDSPAHKPELGSDKTFIFYCAAGGRSALAAKVAAEMGMGPVVNLTGGFSAWKKAGGPVSE
jgi:rhodanese-related sulfurtransferase